MSWSALAQFDGIVATPGQFPARNLPPLSRWRNDDPDQRDRYDTDTLIYGAVWNAQTHRLIVYAPRPLNLLPILQDARWLADGVALGKPKLRRFKRYATLDFAAQRPVARLGFEAGGWQSSCPVQQADHDPFAGCNVLYTMSQNNDLDWVCDWVMYHHRAHGANAVLISDNRSTAYTPEDLRARLVGLGVLKAVLVQSVPYRYGPSSQICTRASDARYLQSATANFVREAWLRRARAVLSCDIDEIVASQSGRSIFDAVCASRLGVVTFPGYWRFCDPVQDSPTHSDHVYTRPDRLKPCPTKYAWRPDGWLGDWSLMTHSLESVPRRWASGAPNFWFLHCDGITTRWKAGREKADATLKQTFDENAKQALARGGL